MSRIKKMFSFFWDRSLLFFAIIGAVNAVITMAGTFLLENYAAWPFLAASVTMFAATSVISFIFNRRFSFKSKAPLGPSILRFSAVIAGCYVLSYTASNLLLPWMKTNVFPGISDLWYSALRIVGLQVVFTLLNYLGQRLWAFKE